METPSKTKAVKSLFNAVNDLRGTGQFYSSGTIPFVFPGLKLQKGEEIAWPLPVAHGDLIKSCAETARSFERELFANTFAPIHHVAFCGPFRRAVKREIQWGFVCS